MGHAVSDAVIDQVRACPHSLQFRLGLQFRRPENQAPLLESPLPARYLRIQAASPPPRRIDRSRWQKGLRVYDGTENGRKFDASDPSWRQSGVFPLEGISPLDQPPSNTIVLDQWLDIPAVAPAAALTTTFTLTPPKPRSAETTNHFISVAYPMPVVSGGELEVAGVTYYREAVLPLTEAKDWIALSFSQFYPHDRESADYIIEVETCSEHPALASQVPWEIIPSW
jgi:hypothetical protein